MLFFGCCLKLEFHATRAFSLKPLPSGPLTTLRKKINNNHIMTVPKVTTSSSASSTRQAASTKELETETVAIIGGGIAGLSCAQFLSQGGKFRPTVFDTGRLRPGGRCSSRRPEDREAEDNDNDYPLLKSTIIDHAAQILSLPGTAGTGEEFQEFQKQLTQWEEEGVILKYPENAVCNILKGDARAPGFRLEPINTNPNSPMYYGKEGMGSIPLRMAQDVEQLEQDVWVAPSNGVRYQKESGKWKLQAKGETLGIFDRIVIAHNGKCADRIMSKTPSKLVHNLLRVNFASSVPKWGGKRMTLNSIYSLSFAVDASSTACQVLRQALPADKFVCGFIQNEPTLRFLSCQSRKYPPPQNSSSREVEVWTVLSSAPFAKKHKAPQEFLPEDVIQNVTSLLLQGLEKSLALPSESLQNDILESRLQLWGAAVPLNVWQSQQRKDTGFLFDGKFGVGVCGDWLLDPSIGGAWESGRRLAAFMTNNPTDRMSLIGVKGSFQASEGSGKAGIGSFQSENPKVPATAN